MEHIYIPLTIVPEVLAERTSTASRVDPLSLLESGGQCVILGDPGSGKSTLLRFLALAGISRPLQERYKAKADTRLSILVTLRKYADEIKSRSNLSLLDYIRENIQADFNLKDADYDFLEYFLESGQSILLFDGMDELPSPHFKEAVRDRIRTLTTTYPGNTVIVTTRIVGYDNSFRFAEEEFRHYRVTKLLLPEIEQFVSDWYRVRIENPREREENVQDLIRILRDDAHTAIRELAENPLLLTIVALVHRIDAVLPDERVVLYQKCTETLLNTWHTWKFRETENKNRGKVERRNRFRMEAIAHWMQCRSASTGRNQRAVVTYDDISDFLTKHISENENPNDSESEPQDLAKDFLEFIKKRAGLLIEVGDNQYSFVHLTFQEYLTSAYIITTCEKSGVEGLWSVIGHYYQDPRWHEVIRLLVAGLKANESQKFLIARILAVKQRTRLFTKSQVLGGLLLDGIEPAEECKNDILALLVASGCHAGALDQVRAIHSLLQNWLAKETLNRESMITAIKTFEKTQVEAGKTSLALLTLSLSLPVEIADEIFATGKPRLALAYECLFGTTIPPIDFSSMRRKLEEVFVAQKALALTSRLLNFIAAVLQSLAAPLGVGTQARIAFEAQLVALTGGYRGPFRDLMLNTILISFDGESTIYRWSATKGPVVNREHERRPGHPQRASFPFLSIHRSRPLKDGQQSNQDSALSRDAIGLSREHLNSKRMHSWLRGKRRHSSESANRALALVHRQIHVLPPTANGKRNAFWQGFLSTPELQETVIELLSDLFALEPRSQWSEALRVRYLPAVPEQMRISDPSVWAKVQKAFEDRSFGETEIYVAAWLLILDSWLKIFGYYESNSVPLFDGLVDVTKTIDAAPIRIAHVIRNMAYGDKASVAALESLLLSDEPAYRSIFEKCLWRGPSPHAGTRPVRVGKRR